MQKLLTRAEAWELLNEYTKTEALLHHALAVEGVMRHFARLAGEDEELWGNAGLLHDLDYEMYPDEHCKKVVAILQEKNVDEKFIRAICSHGYGTCTDIEPVSQLEKTLYTIDELTGLINATCLVRPSKSVLDLEVKSVKKKMKQRSFAEGVDRDIIKKGCVMLGADLGDIIRETIAGMRDVSDDIGLTGDVSAVTQ